MTDGEKSQQAAVLMLEYNHQESPYWDAEHLHSKSEAIDPGRLSLENN